MSSKIIPLEFDKCYHIYNRGNNRENIFREKRNYTYFLERYQHYVHLVAETYAYCLLKNHFHFLVRIRLEEEQRAILKAVNPKRRTFTIADPAQRFSNFFNSYAKSFNKRYDRTGSLFQKNFKRIWVDTPQYFDRLIHYIHFNPQKHGFVDDFREYVYSSYSAMILDKPTKVSRQTVLSIFDGREHFIDFHAQCVDEEPIRKYIEDDVF